MEKKRRLEFTNRCMFNRVVCQESVCKGIIRALLGIEAGSITYLNSEQPYEPGAESRGVRMDVVAKEDGRIYDIEMQLGPQPDLGRRMRYYQAAMDVGELGHGDPWELLPESHIVFIYRDDLLGAGLPVYTFEMKCREALDLKADDGSHWHVLNAEAWEDATDEDVRAMLEYVRTGQATNALSREIDELVERYNEDRKWVGRVMLWEEDTKMRCRQAEERAEERFATLIIRLTNEGRPNDILRIAEDRGYREKLFEEFSI